MTNAPTIIEKTEVFELAAQFVNTTGRHIFLTGKAGTGKTTFLRNLAGQTHKRMLIVAPTGIAALNAGGVTVHSQFLLPLGAYHPDKYAPEASANGRIYSSDILTRKNPLNSIRKQVLRDIELLVIDEVSMLRADILDAVDFRLRAARGNHNKPFGGVQLLMIGDLFQLSPIVKDDEWNILKAHYPTPHFFSSIALRKDGYIYVELSKVFRQRDDKFLNILNNLRHNTCTAGDIAELNKHYDPNHSGEEEVVTLTTHNYQADKINQTELEALKEKPYSYHANITGDFPENIYPLPSELVLKKGAQVMFIKNDTVQNRFYNGKLAKVIALDAKSICVKMAGEDRELKLERMVWNNTKYGMDDAKELTEEIAGTYEQYPIKLAWAITVHKSQGLTFDKAIIDVGKAFAPGQVYVALSRLRTLDGLILRTKINPGGIHSDSDVMGFQEGTKSQGDLSPLLKAGQAHYLQDALHRTFSYSDLLSQAEYIERKSGGKMEFEDLDMRTAVPIIKEKIREQEGNARKFRNQISGLLTSGDYDLLQGRIEKAASYFLTYLYDLLYQTMLHLNEAAQFSRSKAYVNLMTELEQLELRKIGDTQKALSAYQVYIARR